MDLGVVFFKILLSYSFTASYINFQLESYCFEQWVLDNFV